MSLEERKNMNEPLKLVLNKQHEQKNMRGFKPKKLFRGFYF
jgi:hypothetical protein